MRSLQHWDPFLVLIVEKGLLSGEFWPVGGWARQACLGRGCRPPAGVGHEGRTGDEVPGRPLVVHDLVLTRSWERWLRGQGQRLRREGQDGVFPGAGPVSGIVKNPLWVLDTNPARAETLFLCLQQETEAL